MDVVQLRMVCNPSEQLWEQFAVSPPETPRGLSGWVMRRHNIDAGMPPDVGRILTQALCLEFQVSYLIGNIRDARLCTTRDAQAATQLFDVDNFPWELRGQAVLLSDRGTTADAVQLMKLVEAKKIDANKLATMGAGIMLPGVDGDFAEFVMVDFLAWRRLQVALEQTSKTAGIEFQLVSEGSFRSTVWFLS